MQTVRMVRDAEAYPAPHTADVHPAEVENYAVGGWVVSHPLDHDGDGKPGGSLPKAQRKPRGKAA